MISSSLIQRFNMVRALIFVSSPQVQECDGYLVIIDEHGKLSQTIAKLAHSDSFDRLRSATIRRPLSVSLVELPARLFTERYAISEQVSIYHAFMLT